MRTLILSLLVLPILSPGVGLCDEDEELDADFVIVRGQAVRLQAAVITAETADTWIFGTTRAAWRKSAVGSLKATLDRVEKLVSLTPAQRTKIELAGRGDVDQFLQDVDSFQQEVVSRPVPRPELLALHARSQEFQMRVAEGLHGPSSLFERTLRTALDPEQFAQLHEKERARLEAHYEARIDEIVARFARHVLLTDDQRAELHDLMKARTEAPGRLGPVFVRLDHAPFRKSVLRIPDAVFLKIFEEADRPTIQRLLAGMRSQEAMLPVDLRRRQIFPIER